MIKINLLKSKVGSPQTETTYDTSVLEMGIPDAEPSSGVALKLVLMGIFTFLLIIYENYNIGELKDNAAKLTAKARRTQQEVEQRSKISTDAIAYQKQIRELEDKMEVLKKLSKKRLQELKALDYIQNIIPEKVWLSEVLYKKVFINKVAKNEFTIRGFTASDDELTQFLKGLQEKSHFSSVVLVKAAEVIIKEGAVKEFEITSNLELVE